MTGKLDIIVNDLYSDNFDRYNSFVDYDKGDLILRLVSAGGTQYYSKKESLPDFLDSIAGLFTSDVVLKTTSFLDLLLVRNSVFISKYIEWLKQLGKLSDRINELEDAYRMGAKMKLHNGIIFCSAIDDTESKMIERYGGSKWKRIMNFLLGAGSGEIGQRGGASYVCLSRKDVPDHTHNIGLHGSSSADSWKYAGGGEYYVDDASGVSFSDKALFSELSPLGWGGGTRYVKPHLNIPYYKDVYIWECVDANEKTTREPLRGIVEEAELKTPIIDVAAIPHDNGTERGTTISTNEIGIGSLEDKNIPMSGHSFSKLDDIVFYDLFSIIVSDHIVSQDAVARYKTMSASLAELSGALSYNVFFKRLEIERRYLLKSIYQYLVSDIQDRIFLLLKRIKAFLEKTANARKFRASPGQYIFTYNMSYEAIKAQYVVPRGYDLREITGCFLRGTSTYTQENKSDYVHYLGSSTDAADMNDWGFGGSDRVELSENNIPQHHHWSTILGGLKSKAAITGAGTGAESGTDVKKNDPVSGGLMHGLKQGSGNYKYAIGNPKSIGVGTDWVNDKVTHNNIPSYVTMRIYQVVEVI